MSTPEVWLDIGWNSTAGNHTPWRANRITASQVTKADSRALKSLAC